MTVQAIVWVLEEAPIPKDDPSAASLTLVLLGLANHAHRDGTDAFPSRETLSRYSRLSVRTVSRCLNRLEELELIRRGNQAIAAAKIPRADLRPTVWDLAMQRGDTVSSRGPQRGDTVAPNGVTPCPERGDTVSPEPRPEPRPEPTSGRNSAPSPPDGLFEPPPKAKKRGSRLPAGFDVNDDMKAWKRENAPHVHLRNELAQFKDHWAAAAGASAVKLDWVAAWRTWMRRAEADWLRREGQQQRPRPTGTRTRTDPITGHMREEY